MDIGTILSKTIVSILREEPFYGHIIVQLRKKFDDDNCQTAAVSVTDTNINLYINSKWFLKLKEEQRKEILKHEILHLILEHPLRGTKHEFATISNFAADIVVNQLIRHEILSDVLLPKTFNLPDGQNFEWYYKKLLEKTLENLKNNGDKRQKDSQGSSSSANDQGTTRGLEKQIDEELKKMAKDAKLLDDHGLWDESESSDLASELLKKNLVKEVVRRAVDMANGQLPGTIAGYVTEFLSRKFKQMIPWNQWLRRFVSHVSISALGYTKKRISKRYKERPGTILKNRTQLAVALDTSGSIQHKELEMFASELRYIAKNNVDIWVIECDTEVHKVTKFNKKLDCVHGRGGTSFIPVFEFLEKQRKLDVDGLIYFTDSYGEAPETSRIPTLWVLTYGNKNPAKFGWSCNLPKLED